MSTKVEYWLKYPVHTTAGLCKHELERTDVEDGWHRSVMCAKVARFSISFPGVDHPAVIRCREHKDELFQFNPRAVPARI